MPLIKIMLLVIAIKKYFWVPTGYFTTVIMLVPGKSLQLS
jgi:hypothetical protein